MSIVQTIGHVLAVLVFEIGYFLGKLRSSNTSVRLTVYDCWEITGQSVEQVIREVKYLEDLKKGMV